MTLQRCLSALISNLPAHAAIISPGSRNAAIIRSLKQTNIPAYSVLDERSAGFIALGLARAEKRPVILCCTSGTAALNYYPAIAEAFYSRIPLIVLTADRPPESIDNWDGQAIRQNGVFDQHIRASFQTPDAYADEHLFESISKDLANQIKSSVPGPYHINIPIREPFYEQGESDHFQLSSWKLEETRKINTSQIRSELGLANSKVLFFNGYESPGDYIIQAQSGEVVLSDICSGAESSLEHWDAYLFNQLKNMDQLDELKPDVLVTAGMGTVSKGLLNLVRSWSIREHYHLSTYPEVGKPFGTEPKTVQIAGDLDQTVEGNEDYFNTWENHLQPFDQFWEALDWHEYSEFAAVRWILDQLEENSILHLGNSMPIRYVSYVQSLRKMRLFGNRGTSGIDGCLSAAIGHSVSEPVYAMIGDMTALYEIGALSSIGLSKGIKIVVLNNGGGQIFRYLEGPSRFPESFSYQLTEHSQNFDSICEHYGLKYFCADNFQDLEKSWHKLENENGSCLLEIRTNPDYNYEFYTQFKKYIHE